MLQLDRYIEQIEALLEDDTVSSLTYAALECRLAIECVCYERLKLALDFISFDDLKKWQPKNVVNFLISEVDPHIASHMKLSISEDPVEHNLDQAGFEKLKYVLVGTQTGLNTNKLGKLWNALSNVALHTRLPKTRDDKIAHYGEQSSIKKQVENCLEELKQISDGNLLMTSPEPQISVNCSCGKEIKRRIFNIKSGQIFHCNDPSCLETFEVKMDGDDMSFVPRRIELRCQSCGHKQIVPKKMAESMSTNQYIYFNCAGCDEKIHVHWRLMQGQ